MLISASDALRVDCVAVCVSEPLGRFKNTRILCLRLIRVRQVGYLTGEEGVDAGFAESVSWI